MADELRRYHVWNTLIGRLLLFSGLRPSANPSILYRLLLLVHGLTALVMSCTLLNFSRQHLTNLYLCLKGFGAALSFFTIIQKIICLTFYRKHLVQLHASLAITFGQDLEDSKLRPIVLSPLVLFYRPSLILSLLMCGSISVYWLSPPIAIATQYFRGVDIVKLILPFPAVYPWRATGNTWLYMAHYIFEIYAGTCVAMFTSLIDSLFGYYIFQIAGQLRTLSYRITSVKSSEDYRKVIRECVSRHQLLNRCHNLLEVIYGPIVLWTLVTNSIIICVLVYQVSHLNPRKAIPIVVIIIMKFVQTLLYGCFGTFITTESEMFREAIYASDWAGSGEKSLMTDVLIMITQKPWIMNACSVSTISADMFVAVCNTALSYFFMLRTLEQSNRA